MATKKLRFRGHPHVKPGHLWPTPPLTRPVHVLETGQVRYGWLPDDEVVFDRSLAQQHNRVCACHGDGECWAYQHAGAWNLAGYPPVFEVLDVDEPSAGDGLVTAVDTTEQRDDPVQTPAPQTPPRGRARTARS
jgi:hypothetical protein